MTSFNQKTKSIAKKIAKNVCNATKNDCKTTKIIDLTTTFVLEEQLIAGTVNSRPPLLADEYRPSLLAGAAEKACDLV